MKTTEKEMIPCRCGGFMIKEEIGGNAGVRLFLALLTFLVGLFILAAFPGIGWIIGGALMIYALVRGNKRNRKVWRCADCGLIQDRV